MAKPWILLSTAAAVCIIGCHMQPKVAQPVTQTEDCLFTSTDQVTAFIASNMNALAEVRNWDDVCSMDATSGTPMPSTKPTLKLAYDAWVNYLSDALRNVRRPTIDEQLGRRPRNDTFDGLGGGYDDVAAAVQDRYQGALDCRQRNSTNPAVSVTLQPDPCGHDVDCQRAQVQKNSFGFVGRHIFQMLKGCDDKVRQQASSYLNENYYWY
jgi:hypothetical protein